MVLIMMTIMTIAMAMIPTKYLIQSTKCVDILAEVETDVFFRMQ